MKAHARAITEYGLVHETISGVSEYKGAGSQVLSKAPSHVRKQYEFHERIPLCAQLGTELGEREACLWKR